MEIDLQDVFALIERYGLGWGAAVYLFISRERLAKRYVDLATRTGGAMERIASKIEGDQ